MHGCSPRERRDRRGFALQFAAMFLALTPSAGRAAELREIGVSLTDMDNPFFTQIALGVELAARRLGGPGVKVHATSCAYDLQRQISQLERFIEMRVDLIVLTAVDQGEAPGEPTLLLPAYVVTKETTQWPEGAWRE